MSLTGGIAMSEYRNRLYDLKGHQNQLIHEVQTLIDEYESHDLLQENQALRKQYEIYKQQLDELKEAYKQETEENSRLRASLTEQMIDEKLSLLKVSREKLETYFGQEAGKHGHRLEQFEAAAKTDIQRGIERAAHELGEEREEFQSKLNALHLELNDRITAHRERLAKQDSTLFQHMDAGLNHFAGEEVGEDVIQRRIKQNQLEMKIGLSWINKLGILLIIFGVGAAFRYSYSTWFNDSMKGSAFFLLGLLLLAGGEWLFRKQKQTFALGLLGGGISVLYGSIFYSYFLLHILDLYVALSLSVGVTAIAVALSLRYDSRTVCSLGLIGGYLPFFSYLFKFGLTESAVYIAMGYLLLLNLLILLVSFKKRWMTVNYISFMFNMPSVVILALMAESQAVGIVYSVITFMMYLGITLGFPLQYRVKLSWGAVVLLAFNTFISCCLLYGLLDKAELNDFQGLLALVFCILYFFLGRMNEKLMKEEKQTQVLFYVTSLTFGILMIPFQFSIQWLSMGWLVEAVLLIGFGYMKKFKQLERAGWGILLLCLITFFFWDYIISNVLGMGTRHYDLKYTAVITAMLLVTLLYAKLTKQKGIPLHFHWIEIKGILVFKYITLVNVWFYVLYESSEFYKLWVPDNFSHYGFYQGMLAVFVTMGLAYASSKVTALQDRIVNIYQLCLYIVGILLGLILTVTAPVLAEQAVNNTALNYLSLTLLIGFNGLAYFIGRDYLIAVLRRTYTNIELYPAIAGVYIMGILTAFLIVQFRLGDVELVFSLLYLLLAIVYIVYGFRNHYVYIRRLGLGLTLFSTGKLFLYDLSFLTAGSKIIAYFCFGVLLLGISYIYQKVSNRWSEPPGSKNAGK
ncbi:hypothetical protein D3C73_510380 [compost metagenome]